MRGLYAIVDTGLVARHEVVKKTKVVLAAGCRVIQYRNKNGSPEQCLSDARALHMLCTRYHASFIVNDYLDIAATLGCGLHLGGDDTTITKARQTLGPDAIIGASCYNSLERAEAAIAAGASYIAFGAFFPSSTKPEAAVATADVLSAARRFNKPIVAIGGITPDNGKQLITAGADMLAVISSLWQADDIAAQTNRFQNLF